MNRQEWRAYERLAAAVIADALKNIKSGVIDIHNHVRADQDLRWIHDKESSFEIWCHIAGFEPDPFRKKLPEELSKRFILVKRNQFYKRKLGKNRNTRSKL